MLFNLSRKHVQILSGSMFVLGATILFAGWHNPPIRAFSITMMAGSIWLVVMSESVLLGKVQIEMHKALDDISRKKEREVEEVLYFLRDSSIAASPFKSVDGAKRLCQRIPFPAMVLTTNYQIIKANSHMHEVLDWRENELNGVSAHTINDTLVMSRVGSWAAQPGNIDKQCIVTQYAYLKKSGEKIIGQMTAVKIELEGYFVMFMPSDSCLISYDEIRKIV